MKYIDSEKLIAEIESLKSVLMDPLCSQGNILGPDWVAGGIKMLKEISSVITSLQQEQPEFPTTDEEVEKALAYIPKVELPDKYKTPDWLFKQQEQPDIDEIKREWYNKGYLKGRKESNIPARELGLPKSCDMQEQPEVDLEKEIQEHIKECLDVKFPTTDIELIKKDVAYTARKFYELGFNARKE